MPVQLEMKLEMSVYLQELQKKMRSYLDEQTTITQTEAKLKVSVAFYERDFVF